MLKDMFWAITISITIIMPIHAIDIDVPGADSSVSVNAYKNYNYTNESLEKAFLVKETSIINKLKSYHYRDNEISQQVQYSKNTLRAVQAHSTIIRLHSDKDSMRLAMPFSSQFGTYTHQQDSQILEIKNQQIDFSIIADTTHHLRKLNKENPNLNSESKKFSYQSLGDALWFKEKQKSEAGFEMYTTGIQFKNSKNKSKFYHLAFSYE